MHSAAFEANVLARDDGVGSWIAEVRIRQTYVSIRQHTSAYVSIRQHTSAAAYVDSRGAHIQSIIYRVLYRVLYRESGGVFLPPLSIYDTLYMSAYVSISIRQRQHRWHACCSRYSVSYCLHSLYIILYICLHTSASAYVSVSIRQHRWHACCSRYSVSYCLHSLYIILYICVLILILKLVYEASSY
jgi:hypothetical protein